jgi:hypothetical protein
MGDNLGIIVANIAPDDLLIASSASRYDGFVADTALVPDGIIPVIDTDVDMNLRREAVSP